MKTAKLEPTIKRSRAAELLDKTSRTLVRWEKEGILYPIKLNCRAVVYRRDEIQRILNGEIQTAPDRAQPAILPRCTWRTIYTKAAMNRAMKSHLRFSKASGTERAKIKKLIRRGWEPGKRIGDFASKKSKGVGRDE